MAMTVRFDAKASSEPVKFGLADTLCRENIPSCVFWSSHEKIELFCSPKMFLLQENKHECNR